MHFERRNAFQNAQNFIFCQKKVIKKKYVSLPYLKFSDPFTQNTLIFLFGL